MSRAGHIAVGRSSDAPVSGWHRAMADWLVVGSATLVCHVLGIATGLLLRLLLNPAQMGIWQALKLLLSYGNYANLGISKGATRELNVALGSGQLAAARGGLNVAFTVNTLTSLVYALVLIGTGVWLAQTADGTLRGSWALGLSVVGGLAVVGRYQSFHVTLLRTRQQFSLTSRLSLLEALATLCLCVPATWLWGLKGLYFGTLAVMLVALAFVRRHAVDRLRPAWDTAEILRLVGIGGPILLAGAVASFLRSLDKLMILGYLSQREHQLGCYSVALMVTGPLYGLGNMLATVMGPRYGERYGASGDRQVVARLAARASELLAAAMALPAALAVVVAPPLLAWLLPDYQAGLAPTVWLVPGAVAMVLALPGSQYLVAVGRQRRALAAVLLATGVAAAANHVALRGGFALVGVAVATSIAYCLYFLLITALSLWPQLDAAARRRYVQMLLLALGPSGATAWLLQGLSSGSTGGGSVSVSHACVVTAVWALSVVAGWYGGGWREQMGRPQ